MLTENINITHLEES